MLALETAGKEFFGRFDRAFGNTELRERLRYFARSHEEVEANHHLTDATEAAIFDRLIGDEAWREAVDAVAATFDAMTRIAEAMARTLEPCG